MFYWNYSCVLRTNTHFWGILYIKRRLWSYGFIRCDSFIVYEPGSIWNGCSRVPSTFCSVFIAFHLVSNSFWIASTSSIWFIDIYFRVVRIAICPGHSKQTETVYMIQTDKIIYCVGSKTKNFSTSKWFDCFWVVHVCSQNVLWLAIAGKCEKPLLVIAPRKKNNQGLW